MKLGTVLALALAAAAFAGPPAPPAGWTDGYVLANGIRLHYWRAAAPGKPALVFAHGSSDDALCWTNFARNFQGQYDIIMFDARGHGLSDPPQPSDPADAQVEDLAGLIRELNLTKPILMGHSMGSASVAWFSAKYPDIPRAVILEDPNLGARRPPSPDASDPEKRKREVIARNNLTHEELVARCRKDNPKWSASECEIWAPSKRRHHPNTALLSISNRPPMKDLFERITAPTLILKADAQGDQRTANEETAKILKSGKIVHIDGAGHNVRREGVDQTLQVLQEFLKSL